MLVSRSLVLGMFSVNAETVSIDNAFLGFVYSEKETSFCRKLTAVGL